MFSMLKMAQKIVPGRTRRNLIKTRCQALFHSRTRKSVAVLFRKLAPKVLQDPDSVFYWKPKEVVSVCDDAPWFTLQVIGRNNLASMVKKMFQEVGIEGKTNHLLRAIGATHLFEANVPEKLIKERTGHKSLDALRLYEHTSTEQQKSVSSLLCSSEGKQFSQCSTSTCNQVTESNTAFSGAQTMFKDFNIYNCTFNITFNQK